MEGTRLLIADADSTVRNILSLAAREEGFACETAADGIAALKLFRRQQFHAALLSVDLPELDGRTVCRQLRKSVTFPVLFLGRSGSETDRMSCFSVGGTDYIPKPFYPREVMARVKALLSLYGHAPQAPTAVVQGGIVIDLQAKKVSVDGLAIRLTPKEYDLLQFLCQNPSRVYSRDLLLDLVWGEGFFGSDRTVDTHIKSIRSKIKPYQDLIVTVWGVGYKFEGQ